MATAFAVRSAINRYRGTTAEPIGPMPDRAHRIVMRIMKEIVGPTIARVAPIDPRVTTDDRLMADRATEIAPMRVPTEMARAEKAGRTRALAAIDPAAIDLKEAYSPRRVCPVVRRWPAPAATIDVRTMRVGTMANAGAMKGAGRRNVVRPSLATAIATRATGPATTGAKTTAAPTRGLASIFPVQAN
jgi:hypothetical protein